MKLVFGLGNPGPEYRDTFHNVGFKVVDRLASRFIAPDFVFDKKSNALVSDCTLFGERVLLCEPQTFMNLSGDSVSHLAHYYKVEPKNILVVYDDIDIPKGTVRARASGSAGTHNGMRDIVYKLGSTEFSRVRVGIGFRNPFMSLADYVLSRVPQQDKALMDKAYAAAADFVEDFLGNKQWTELTKSVSDK